MFFSWIRAHTLFAFEAIQASFRIYFKGLFFMVKTLLCMWVLSRLYSGFILKFCSFWLRLCSACVYSFGSSIWFLDQTVTTEAGWDTFGPLLWEQGLLHWNCAVFFRLWSFPLEWDCSMVTGWKAFGLAPLGQAVSLELARVRPAGCLSCKMFKFRCLSCKLFKLFENYFFSREKPLKSGYLNISGCPPTGTLDDFMFKNHGPSLGTLSPN